MNQINILFIIYDLERGGPEMRLLDFVKYFSNDLKIYICVTSENLSLLKEFKKFNVDIKVIPVSKIYLEITKIIDIYKYIKKHQIAIVNSFDIKGLILAVFAKLLGNRKLKVVHHVVNMPNRFRFIDRMMLWVLSRFVDSLICNSLQLKRILKDKYINESKVDLIYNGIDSACFCKHDQERNSLREKHNIKKNEIVLGTVANFRKQKNYPFLINAFRILQRNQSNLKLLCVGGGEELDDIKEMSEKYGLRGKVIFTGYTDNVPSYLNMMDVFVFCSLFEGLPNAVLQAMSVGVPVISSFVSGCDEIIDSYENGILFKPNNMEEFISKVDKLLEDEELVSRLVCNGRMTIQKRFSLEKMIDNYSAVFRKHIRGASYL